MIPYSMYEFNIRAVNLEEHTVIPGKLRTVTFLTLETGKITFGSSLVNEQTYY